MSGASGRQDSTLGIWVINLIAGTRHFLSVTRSSDACQCGCRGWCTTYPHLAAARWQVESMKDGQRPAFQFNGSQWPDDAPSGALSFRAALIWVKGDWSEHAKSL
eukprot:1833603-Pyramimonas_sp.AAC.1